MKLTLRMLAVSVLAVLVFAGCSNREELQSARTDRDAIVTAAGVQSAKVISDTDALQKDMARSKAELQSLITRIESQEKRLEDIKFAARTLNEAATGIRAKSQVADETGGLGRWFLYLFIVIVVVLILYILYKLLKPKPFEEDEEDDFSSFDDDFGFEDEEEGDDLGDEDDPDKKD